MTARIKSIDNDLITLDDGHAYRAERMDMNRLSSWNVNDKVRIGYDYLFHFKREKKVHVRRER